MGLKYGTVILENYNYNWKVMYEKEKKELKKILGELALEIEHIGSTSIENLKSKPIIDIAVGVKSLKDFDKVRKNFLKEPYSVKENPVEGEELVIKGYPETIYLIHFMEKDSKRYKDTLIFRDYLRNNSKAVKEYEKLKETLAIKYKNDRNSYTKAKDVFIKNVIKEAYEINIP